MKSNKARVTSGLGGRGALRMPPSAVDPVGQMRLQIQNKQTNMVRATLAPHIFRRSGTAQLQTISQNTNSIQTKLEKLKIQH